MNFVLGFFNAFMTSEVTTMGIPLLGFIFSIATIVPSLAVQVRRLHDIDKSGWWILISFIPIIGAIWLIVWFCLKGTEGDNRFGSDPLQAE